MRKSFLSKIAFLSMAIAIMTGFASCDDNGGNEPETDGGLKVITDILSEGNVIGNGDQEVVFKGTQTLTKGTYVLKGWVYVAEGSQLTIEPGTVIKGDKATKAALIVERGAKLIAEGTQNEPIVFTSAQPAGQRRPGDWGGVILCGKAKNNQKQMQIEGGPRSFHGGDDDADNSGVLKYVRIEFAGYPFDTDKEINGLTLGSVGSGTTIDYVQVSYSNDDAYEWFGGTVNCRHLVSFRTWDDDFDTDNGFSGNVQYGLVVRDSRIADTSRSNSFESDNCADGAQVDPYTTAVFSNMSFFGPYAVDNNFENTESYINGGSLYPNNGSALGLFQSAMQIRRSSRLNCVNSVAVGYPVGLIIDGEKGNTPAMAQAGNIKLQNVWFAGMKSLGSDANKVTDDYLVTGYDADKKPVFDKSKESYSSTFFKSQPGNKVLASADELNLTGDNFGFGVNFMPASGSPLLSAASFSGLTGFDQVTFVGAFGSDNWLTGWTNFNPENTAY